jgi:hypothetical protein
MAPTTCRRDDEGTLSGARCSWAFVGEKFIGPHAHNNVHCFGEQPSIGFLVSGVSFKVERDSVAWPGAATESNFDSTFGQVVEQRKVFCKAQRMPHGRSDTRKSDLDAARVSRQIGCQHHGIRRVAESLRVQMMLSQQHCVESQFVAEPDLFSPVIH